MKFFEKLLKKILDRNLLQYNLLVTILTTLIFFLIYYLGSILVLKLVNMELIKDALVSTVIAPIIIGVLDLVFCLFILILNLKFRKSDEDIS